MKKILLFCAAAMLMCACNETNQSESNVENAQTETSGKLGTTLPIAIVNVDSLLSNYTLAQEANERLIKQQESARLELNQKARSLQNEMIEFQKKIENNAFLSRERAEQEQARLMKKEQSLANREQEMSQKLLEDQQNFNLEVRDSINAAIKIINQSGKYHLILSTNSMNDNVLFNAPEYDISQEVLTILNSRYKSKE